MTGWMQRWRIGRLEGLKNGEVELFHFAYPVQRDGTLAEDKLDIRNPPPPLSTGEPGSFAYKTLTTRKPAVLRQVLADYDYPPPIVEAVEALMAEITGNKPIVPLRTSAPDAPAWAAAWQAVSGRPWLDAPWYFAEAFLYRRLLEAVNYFAGHGQDLRDWAGLDPFWPRKLAELQSNTPWQVLSAALRHSADNTTDSLRTLLHHAVWGNRIDLSYNQVAEATGRDIAIEREQENLLVDHSDEVVAYLTRRSEGTEEQRRYSISSLPLRPSAPLPKFDFICDNAGTELLMDLALADFLLRFDWAQQVTFHVKAHPTYVSDTIPADVDQAIVATRQRGGSDFSALAGRLAKFVIEDRLCLRAHLFWNSSRFFWDIPRDLQAELAQARLVIIKGDANYRRLVGDHRWSATTPLANVAAYFPAFFVCLRTMKSDPIVGLQPGQAATLDQEDAAWRVNGRRGMVQAWLE